MEILWDKEPNPISKRQMFLQILEILTEQGLLREEERNLMKVMLTQLPVQDRSVEWNGQ